MKQTNHDKQMKYFLTTLMAISIAIAFGSEEISTKWEAVALSFASFWGVGAILAGLEEIRDEINKPR